MPQENEATTILEIQVNDVTYDRLCRTAEAFDKKATVEDVVQAMIQWHLKGGAPSPFFSGKHDLEAGWNILEECPDKLEPSEAERKKVYDWMDANKALIPSGKVGLMWEIRRDRDKARDKRRKEKNR